MRLTTKLLGVSCALVLSACGEPAEDSCSADKIMGTSNQFATNSIKLPSSTASYSIDIDGDGRPDNQLKAIISAVASANFDLDMPIQEAVANGEAVILADVQAADLMAGCSKVTLNLAAPPAMGSKPKFDGTDTFTKASAQAPAVLTGKITGGKISSILPKDQKGDQVQKITLNLPLADGNLPLSIYGAHIQGSISASGIMSGEIHGVIRKMDIDEGIIPAIAKLLTQTINKSPTSSSTETIIRLFEDPMGNAASKTKCMVAKDCCQMKENRATCKITSEEVRTNALIGNVLAADVQVFQNGVWSPVPKGPMKDAMSVGLGFTSVKAKF